MSGEQPDKPANSDLSFGERRDGLATRCRTSDTTRTVQRLHECQPDLRLHFKTIATRLLGKSAMAFIPLGTCRAMSVSGTLRLIKMNMLEQSLTDNRKNRKVDRTLNSRVTRRTPVLSSVRVAGKKHGQFRHLIFLMPLGAVALIVYKLQAVPAEIIREEFEGFGIALCAAGCVGVFVWRLTRAMELEQRLEVQPPVENQASVSPSEPNSTNPRIVQSSLPPETAAVPAAPVASFPAEIRI